MEENKNISALDGLNLQISEKRDEIEKLQYMIGHVESGASDRDNYASFDRGEISEEVYLEKKDKLDKEYNEAKEKIKIAKEELDELEEKRKLEILELERQKEIEKLDLEIEEKMKQIGNISINLEYYESGEAYRENQVMYEMGAITEEEYVSAKESIDKAFDDTKEKMEIATKELQILKEKRDKLMDEKSTKKENVVNDEKSKDKGREEIVEQEISEEEKSELEKSIDENINEREVIANNNKAVEKEKVNSSSGQSISKDENEIEEEEIIVANNQLQTYKKPNRFISFFKRIIEKIREGGKKDKDKESKDSNRIQEDKEFEEKVARVLDETEEKEVSFIEGMQGLVYDTQTIVQKTKQRESEEKQLDIKEKTEIEIVDYDDL